jgi:iron complex transport system substrate-binding protein
MGLGDFVQGVTLHCNYPPEVKDKPTVGEYMDLSVEKIISLKPDLVLATSYQDQAVASLTALKIPVVVLDATTVAGIYDCLRSVGALTDRAREAQRLIADMTREVDSIKGRVSSIPDADRPKVLYLAWDSPILTAGPGTLLHDMITIAGGRNVAANAKEPYPVFSMETVVLENPDVSLIPRVQSSLDLKTLRETPGWRSVKAVREGRVYLLDDDLVSRPGPRAVQGLRQIAEALHPDKFRAVAP